MNPQEPNPKTLDPQEPAEQEPKNDPNNENLPKELVAVLLDLVKKYDEEDSWIRKRMLKMWKKNEEFWHGIQYIFWSETNQEWLVPTDPSWPQGEEGREGAEGPFYDYVINIYRAHGESIIAALSAGVPVVRFPPDDAEDEDDLTTSETYSKISDLIARHNSAKLLLMDALFTMWNQGLVASYHAPKYDRAFGTIKIPKFSPGLRCETCGHEIPGEDGQVPDQQPCPECAQGASQDPAIPPTAAPQMSVAPVISGYTDSPKSRVIIENYGPINVKFPYFARRHKDAGYLGLKLDQPVAFLKDCYSHIAEEISETDSDMGQFERIARAPSSFSSYSTTNENRDLRPLGRWWFRPWILAGIPDSNKAEREALQKLFPDGTYCCFIGDTYVESRNECQDKYWSVAQAGLSRYIHSDPLGQPLISIQEMRNVLANLTLETIEHGIPSSYADPEVVDFSATSRHEARPGMVTPATPKPGMNLNQSFYEGARATLGQEVPVFADKLDQDGQFVTGSFPSIYGGPSEGDSRTATEYNQSRQMALQRLSICLGMVNAWWCSMMKKCVDLYIENMVEDEKFVVSENNSWVNVWIRRENLTGKVGDVEPESDAEFPMSLAQKKTLLMSLLQLNSDFVNAAVFDVENRKNISQALGYPDLFIPGENQRVKQMREINLMLKGQPQEIAPQDDNEIHANVCKNFLVSSKGMDAQRVNPQGYALIEEHFQQHQLAEAASQATSGALPGAPIPPGGGNPPAPVPQGGPPSA